MADKKLKEEELKKVSGGGFGGLGNNEQICWHCNKLTTPKYKTEYKDDMLAVTAYCSECGNEY